MRKIRVGLIADEEMNVIWHDHEPPDSYSAFCACSRKFDESPMDSGVREHPFAPMRVERDEVKRRIVLLKDEVQPRGTSGTFTSMML